MADTKFDLSKLSKEQLKVAGIIIDECTALGVNPDLALPMAFVESRFNQDAKSPRGAIGVMQLMPDTAKDLNVDPYDLRQNIRGGCHYIQQLMEHPQIAHDPTLLIAAYHDGHNSEFFKTNDPSKISNAALGYIHDVNKLSGGMIAPTNVTPGEIKEQAVSGEPQATDTWSSGTLAKSEEPPKAPYGFDPMAMSGGAIPGVGTGAAVGTSRTALQLGQKSVDLARELSSNLRNAGPGTPPANPYGGTNWTKSLTDVDLPNAQMNQRSLSDAQRLASIVGRGGELAGGELRSGVAIGPDIRAKQQQQPPSMLQRAKTAAAPVGRVMNAPLVRGPLGGLEMGALGAEAMSRMHKGDYPGAALAGTGSLAAGASMFGVPYSPAVAMAAPAALAGYDYVRNTSPEQVKKDIKAAPEAISAATMQQLSDWEKSFKAMSKRYQQGNIPVQPDALSGGMQ
jgi:hypothetical protein